MPARPPILRRVLSALFALSMAMGLLHGPSMAMAESVAVNPARAAAHHMPQHQAAAHDVSGHAADDHGKSPHQDGGALNTVPNCPMANIAAIVPVAPAQILSADGIVLAPFRQAPLVSVDLNALDPPPRIAA